MNLHRSIALAVLTLLLLACTAPAPAPTATPPSRQALPAGTPPPPMPTATPPPGATVTPTPNTAQTKLQPGATVAVPGDPIGASRTVRDYYQWLSAGRAADARNLLTVGYQQRNPAPNDGALPPGVKIEATRVEPQDVGANRIRVRVELQVSGPAGSLGPWNAGTNTRYLELQRTGQGWRIDEIASSPAASGAA